MERLPSSRDDRRETRHEIKLPSELRQRSSRARAVLSDISAHGCCISGYEGHVSLHAPVHVRPQGMEPMLAWVRWKRGDEIGCEFARALYGPVLEHLVACHGTPVEIEARAA
jgi:hypothetical protein